MKHNHFRLFAILIGLAACAGCAYGVWHFWKMPAEGHWTVGAFSPPLAQASDRLEVLLAAEPILKLAEQQAVVLKQKTSETPVTAEMLTVRLNNYDRVRFAKVPVMLGLAAGAGAGLVLLLIGLFTPLIKALKPPEIVEMHLLEE